MKFVSVVVLIAMCLSGCQAIKSFGKQDTLAYRTAKTLPPLLLPAGQATIPFTPLYEVPAVNQSPYLQNSFLGDADLPKPPKLMTNQN